MSQLLLFLMYWCGCVCVYICVCMSSEASSLEELGPQLLITYKRVLKTTCATEPQKFLRHLPENRSCLRLPRLYTISWYLH